MGSPHQRTSAAAGACQKISSICPPQLLHGIQKQWLLSNCSVRSWDLGSQALQEGACPIRQERMEGFCWQPALAPNARASRSTAAPHRPAHSKNTAHQSLPNQHLPQQRHLWSWIIPPNKSFIRTKWARVTWAQALTLLWDITGFCIGLRLVTGVQASAGAHDEKRLPLPTSADSAPSAQ